MLRRLDQTAALGRTCSRCGGRFDTNDIYQYRCDPCYVAELRGAMGTDTAHRDTFDPVPQPATLADALWPLCVVAAFASVVAFAVWGVGSLGGAW